VTANVDRPRAQVGRATWPTLTALVPELLDLEQRVKHVVRLANDGKGAFCANALWYGASGKRTIKSAMARLVGYAAADRLDPLVMSSDAYDLVYERLYALLPDCRHEPGCCWAADEALYELWLQTADFDTTQRPVRRVSNARRQWQHLQPLIAPAVFELAGYRCALCGASERLSVDHIVPLDQGGTNDIRNLRALCRSCNSRKGAR
jgi:hypothetical protein